MCRSDMMRTVCNMVLHDITNWFLFGNFKTLFKTTPGQHTTTVADLHSQIADATHPTPPPDFHVVFGVLEEIGNVIGTLIPRISAPIPLGHPVSDAVRS